MTLPESTLQSTLDSPVIINSRYQVIDKLGSGGMGTVYRTLDRLTGQTVALKQVITRSEHLRNSEYTAQLAREFRFLASLRHPNIISVLDYGFDSQGQPYYTMSYVEGARELLVVARERDTSGQIDLLLQMLQALSYLHRRGILHRDLKPANVLVDANGQVRLVDFGLAVEIDEKNTPAGTLTYLAPEVLGGKPAVVQSDLFAFGVITYQVLSGELPFKASTPISLIYNIFHEPLNTQPLPSEFDLNALMAKLLAASIEARFATADEIIRALCEAVGRPIAHESYATRESFLQASRFVGREAEIALLMEALQRTREGQGSAWLVGGESGVGKSRLLDEVQTQALLDGALVLRGQAIAEGGLSFQLWRDALRRLSLQSTLTDVEAAILQPVVPDLDRLLGRDIAEMPQVETQSTQLRLLSVIESMFRQQRQLIVLLLEDLHWAEDSLVLLKRLSEVADTLQLLIIGTYRNDERPAMPSELPMLHHIRLDRLSPAAIETLSVSMLGENGRSQQLVDLLKRETEGNVFFIVEVVRALAEEAGQLSDVGRKTLPHHVFADGMRTVIQRRLDRVPEPARAMMTLAAVVGRELDLTLLSHIMPTVDLDQWLQQVATVIDVQNNRYYFAHDKLRERILDGLTPDQRLQLHRSVAESIETTYPNIPEQYSALAYHWGQAKDSDKTIHYATLAGQEALRSGSYRDAIEFFEQALSFKDQAQLNKRQLSNLYHLLGDAQWGQSERHRSREAHIKALRLLGYAVPESPGQLTLGIIRPLLRHIWRHIARRKPQDNHRQVFQIAAESFHQIAQSAYHDADLPLGLHSVLHGMNAAEQIGTDMQAVRLQARFYITLGFVLGDVSLYRLAGVYFRLAKHYLKLQPDPEMLAWYDFIYGFHLGGRGRWQEAEPLFDQAIQLSTEVGNLGLWVQINQTWMRFLTVQCRYAEAERCIENTIQVAVRDKHTNAMGMLYMTRALLLFLQGKTPEAFAEYFNNKHVIEAAVSYGEQTVNKIGMYGTLIHLYRREEDWDSALKLADMLDSQLKKANTISSLVPDEGSASIALYLTLWEKRGTESYGQLAAQMLDLFHQKYTHHYEIGQTVEYTYRCWYFWLKGDERRARANGALAIHSAQAYQMPYHEAMAHYQLARFMPETDPERAAHLATAHELFMKVGAVYDAGQTERS